MNEVETIRAIKSSAKRMNDILSLNGSPIGVKLLYGNDIVTGNLERLNHHRYCQALMKARRGETVMLDGNGISCPAAASAFGFKPLPEMLKSGKGLVGFGIVNDEYVGASMFEGMKRLPPGSINGILLFPLDKAESVPDVIVVEDEPEKLMWIVLSYMHLKKGARVEGSTAVLQATCVDSTIIPYTENRMNFGLGCYGCRDATDIGGNETIIGFSATYLSDITGHLEYLNKKAIPNSRSKIAYRALGKAESRCIGHDNQ